MFANTLTQSVPPATSLLTVPMVGVYLQFMKAQRNLIVQFSFIIAVVAAIIALYALTSANHARSYRAETFRLVSEYANKIESEAKYPNLLQMTLNEVQNEWTQAVGEEGSEYRQRDELLGEILVAGGRDWFVDGYREGRMRGKKSQR